MTEALELLQYVFAGLVASWVFYGLIPVAKPSAFNRLVDALVLTALIRLIMQGIALAIPPLAPVLERVENPSSLADSFFGSLLVIGFSALFGLFLAILTNKNIPHKWLIARGWTNQEAIRSNLSHAFSVRQDSFVVLNMRDGRRLYGWPLSWPDKTDDNYFCCPIMNGCPPSPTSALRTKKSARRGHFNCGPGCGNGRICSRPNNRQGAVMMKNKQRVKSPPSGIAQGFWRFNPNPPPPSSARPNPPPAPPAPPKKD